MPYYECCLYGCRHIFFFFDARLRDDNITNTTHEQNRIMSPNKQTRHHHHNIIITHIRHHHINDTTRARGALRSSAAHAQRLCAAQSARTRAIQHIGATRRLSLSCALFFSRYFSAYAAMPMRWYYAAASAPLLPLCCHAFSCSGH